MTGYNDNYGTIEELNEKLLYKRIIEWNTNFGELILEDGTIITLEESESDCCASAGGTFTNVKLDAVITNVEIGEVESEECEDGMTTNSVTVTLYHNQNPIAQADMYADDGNGGYYYSVGSFVVDGIHYPIINA